MLDVQTVRPIVRLECFALRRFLLVAECAKATIHVLCK